MIGRFFKYEEFRNKRILSEKYISLKMFTVIHYSSFDPIFSLVSTGKENNRNIFKVFPGGNC